MSSAPPQPVASATAIAMAATARATLTLTVPQRVQNGRRRAYVSPYTAYVGLWQTSGGATVFSTQLPLAYPYCSGVGTYTCYANLAVGSYNVYASLYDATMRQVATTAFQATYPTSIYANGSYYGNYVSLTPYPLVAKVVVPTAIACDVNRGFNQFAIYVLDADNNAVTGPIANPFSITSATVAGASGNLYFGDPVYGSLSGVTIGYIGSPGYTPSLTQTGGDAEIGFYLTAAYGGNPTLRVGNVNFTGGQTAYFAIGSEMLWSPNGSTVAAQALMLPYGGPNTAFWCGSAQLYGQAGTPTLSVITGAPAAGPDAYILTGGSSPAQVDVFWTASGPGRSLTFLYAGSPSYDPVTYFRGGYAAVNAGPTALVWEPAIGNVFSANGDGSINVFPNPATGSWSTISSSPPGYVGTPAKHMAVLANYPAGHSQIIVADGTTNVYDVDFYPSGASQFTPASFNVGYADPSVAAYNSGSYANVFFREVVGGQVYAGAYDLMSGALYVNPASVGTSTAGAGLFVSRGGGLAGNLLAIDGAGFAAFPYGVAPSAFSAYAFSVLFNAGSAITNFVHSTTPHYLGLNAGGTFYLISNSFAPSLYLTSGGFSGKGVVTGN